MTLPSSGKLSLGDINVELGLARTTKVSLGQSAVRTLLGALNGVVKASNARGATYVPPIGLAYQWTPTRSDYNNLISLVGPLSGTFQGKTTALVLSHWTDGSLQSSIGVNVTEAPAVVARNIKAVTIAGLTIPITSYVDGTSKYNISTASATLTHEQGALLAAAVQGKTNTIYLHT